MKKTIKIILILLILIEIIILIKCSVSLVQRKNVTEQVYEMPNTKISSNQNNIERLTVTTTDVKKEEKVPVYKKGEKNLKIPILIYHAFGAQIPEGDKYNLFSTGARFEENIKTLLDEGYTFITLEDIYNYNKGNIGLPEKNITITMDDGWLGCYTEAFSVLKRYNVPATIFIVENLVGTQGYFSWEQAKEMYDTGLVKIHAHGRNHVEATGYSKEKLVEDYNHTQKIIEEKLGEKVPKIMAYPSGKSSPNTIKWLKEAGFEVQVQTKYGTINQSNTLNLTGLGRIRGERATGKSILNSIKNHLL